MAAIRIEAPGTDFGPCMERCKHEDCRESRSTASSVCVYCGKRIGYETKYFSTRRDDGGWNHAHAACEEEAVDAQ